MLESLLAGDDEAPMKTLATLRSGATYWMGDGERPSSVHRAMTTAVSDHGCSATIRLGAPPSPVSTIIPFTKAASIGAPIEGMGAHFVSFAYLSAVPPEL
ncbi:hypothetical protein [Streptomyces sp. NPDC001388]|uniref:hypothetical protein n=1 Tax=Streptomyces sp. NPDC001388 TaxID=3364568 RepID=UPI0036A7B871